MHVQAVLHPLRELLLVSAPGAPPLLPEGVLALMGPVLEGLVGLVGAAASIAALVLLVAYVRQAASGRQGAPGALDELREEIAGIRSDIKARAAFGPDIGRIERMLLEVQNRLRHVEDRIDAFTSSSAAHAAAPPRLPPDVAPTDVRTPAEGRFGDSPEAQPAIPYGDPVRVLERVVNRLLALGYEEIEIITPRDEIDAELARGGELVVEARRAGGAHKGRVSMRDGVVSDVALRPAHQVFP